jgi:thymidine phosphorylase
VQLEYRAPRDGVVQSVTPRTIGHGIVALGGGRRTMRDVVDPRVGFDVFVKPGASVNAGEVIGVIHAADADGGAVGRVVLDDAIAIGDTGVDALPLVSHRITLAGVEPLA